MSKIDVATALAFMRLMRVKNPSTVDVTLSLTQTQVGDAGPPQIDWKFFDGYTDALTHGYTISELIARPFAKTDVEYPALWGHTKFVYEETDPESPECTYQRFPTGAPGNIIGDLFAPFEEADESGYKPSGAPSEFLTGTFPIQDSGGNFGTAELLANTTACESVVPEEYRSLIMSDNYDIPADYYNARIYKKSPDYIKPEELLGVSDPANPRYTGAAMMSFLIPHIDPQWNQIGDGAAPSASKFTGYKMQNRCWTYDLAVSIYAFTLTENYTEAQELIDRVLIEQETNETHTVRTWTGKLVSIKYQYEQILPEDVDNYPGFTIVDGSDLVDEDDPRNPRDPETEEVLEVYHVGYPGEKYIKNAVFNPFGAFPFSFDIFIGYNFSPPYLRAGANCWIGSAMCYYMKKTDTYDYLDQCKDLADWLLTLQVTQASDPRYGLITGGAGSFATTYLFNNSRPTWCSTEHNIDAYFFFKELFSLTLDHRYFTAYRLIGKSLIDNAWIPEQGRFAQGIRKEGIDTAFALDVSTWAGCMAVAMQRWDIGEKCYQTALDTFAVYDKSILVDTDRESPSYNEVFDSTETFDGMKTYHNATDGNGIWEELDTVPVSQTSYIHEGLDTKTTYSYKVRAINSFGSTPNKDTNNHALLDAVSVCVREPFKKSVTYSSNNPPSYPYSTEEPDAPAKVTAKQIDVDKIEISWTPPVNEGGASITDYIIEFNEGSGGAGNYGAPDGAAAPSSVWAEGTFGFIMLGRRLGYDVSLFENSMYKLQNNVDNSYDGIIAYTESNAATSFEFKVWPTPLTSAWGIATVLDPFYSIFPIGFAQIPVYKKTGQNAVYLDAIPNEATFVPPPEETCADMDASGTFPLLVGGRVPDSTSALSGSRDFLITVSGLKDIITDVNVRIAIHSHFSTGDLTVSLTSPLGTSMVLFDGVGEFDTPPYTENIKDVLFDNAASTSIEGNVDAPDISGTYRPQGSLGAFVGEDPNGTWKITVTDNVGIGANDISYLYGVDNSSAPSVTPLAFSETPWASMIGTELILDSSCSPHFEVGSSIVGQLSNLSVYTGAYAVQVTGITSGTKFDRVAVHIASTSGSFNYKIGIYSDSGGVPDALLAETASTAASIGFDWVTLTSELTLTGTKLWIAYMPSAINGEIFYSAGSGENAAAYDVGSDPVVTYPTFNDPWDGTILPPTEIIHAKIGHT